jgi:hypothetical protein
MLGKRKREVTVARREPVVHEELDTQASPVQSHDLFRKYFEAKFNPLAGHQIDTVHSVDDNDEGISSDEDDDELDEEDIGDSESVDSEWSGISEHAVEVPIVEVIDYGQHSGTLNNGLNAKALQKSFMVC